MTSGESVACCVGEGVLAFLLSCCSLRSQHESSFVKGKIQCTYRVGAGDVPEGGIVVVSRNFSAATKSVSVEVNN